MPPTAGRPAPPAARGRGRAGRPPRRRGPLGVCRRSAPAASAVASSLAAIRTSVASSVTFAAGGVDAAVEQRGRVRARRADRRRATRSSPRASRARRSPASSAPPARRRGRSSSASRGGTSARPGRPDQDRVGVAVEREIDETELVARWSRPCARAGRGTASGNGPRRSRRVAGQRLLVHPGEHQDPPVGGVLDDRRGEAVRAPSGSVRARRSWRVMPRPPATAGPGARPRPSPA